MHNYSIMLFKHILFLPTPQIQLSEHSQWAVNYLGTSNQLPWPIICCVLRFLAEGTEMIFFYLDHIIKPVLFCWYIVDPVILCSISPYTGGCAWGCLSCLTSRVRHFFGAGVPKDQLKHSLYTHNYLHLQFMISAFVSKPYR